jgi:hypothetical protein
MDKAHQMERIVSQITDMMVLINTCAGERVLVRQSEVMSMALALGLLPMCCFPGPSQTSVSVLL